MSSIDVGVMLRSKLNSTDKQISYLYPATRDIDVLLTDMNDDGSGSLA